MKTIEICGLVGLPEFDKNTDVATAILENVVEHNIDVFENDIFLITQKIISKAEGRVINITTITPSKKASDISVKTGKDPRLVELILRESTDILRIDEARGIIIAQTNHGFICANAGIDSSNIPGNNNVSLLPLNPDRSARVILQTLKKELHRESLAVIITDTFGRPWRQGHVNFAIGSAGLDPFMDYRHVEDAVGKKLTVTRIAIADELASAAELMTGKFENIPIVLIRGVPFIPSEGGAQPLLRVKDEDLFR